VKVVHGLAALRAVVDDHTEAALGQALLPGYRLRDEHQVAQQRLVILTGVGQPGEAVSMFGNNQEVDRSLGADIAERQALVIIVNDRSWDFLSHYLVKDCGRVGVGQPAIR
jgi:hypothetical protein